MTVLHGGGADGSPPDTRLLVRSDTALWRSTLDGVLLLERSSSATPVVLGGPAVDAWELLAEPITVGELVVQLASRFDVSTDQVSAEVRPLLDRLLELALVHHVDR